MASNGVDRPLAATALLSLALNMTGITWGLPARWHPDEKADVALQMVREGRLVPDSFVNPTLPLFLLAPFLRLQEGAAAAGFLSGPLADPYLLGRALSALAGAGAVLLVGLAARPYRLPPLLLAVAPGFANLCHFVTPEPWLLLGTGGTLLLAVKVLEGRAPVWALGLVLGLTVSTKYTAAALAAAALVAVIGRTEPGSPRPSLVAAAGAIVAGVGLALALGLDRSLAARLAVPGGLLHSQYASSFMVGLGRVSLLAGGALVALAIAAWRDVALARRAATSGLLVLALTAATGFVAGTPGALLEPLRFLSDLAYDHQTRFEYKGLVGGPSSYLAYLGFLADALTLPFAFAAGAGALRAAWRRTPASLAWLCAAVVPYLAVASAGHQAMRFLAPALPAAVILAGEAVAVLPMRGLRQGAQALLVGRAALGTALLLRLFFVDSRVLAARWMAAHIPRGSVVDVITNHPGYAPSPPPGVTLRTLRTLSREMAPPQVFAAAAERFPEEASSWVVLTGALFQRFLDHPEQRPERARFFGDLLAGRLGFEVVARFQQEGWRRPPAEFVDPEIVILRRSGEELGRPGGCGLE
jgi:hypothetical protein